MSRKSDESATWYPASVSAPSKGVDPLWLKRSTRDDYSDSGVRVQDLVHISDRSENLSARHHRVCLLTNETHHFVSEAWTALIEVIKVVCSIVGSDYHDSPK